MIQPRDLFKCLSDDTRLLLAQLIRAEGELCVCELMEALNDSQPKISRHLAQLRTCNIVNDARRGQWVFYSIEPNLPAWALDILDLSCLANKERIASSRKNLQNMDHRPSCG